MGAVPFHHLCRSIMRKHLNIGELVTLVLSALTLVLMTVSKQVPVDIATTLGGFGLIFGVASILESHL